jgi:hypothetical protein
MVRQGWHDETREDYPDKEAQIARMDAHDAAGGAAQGSKAPAGRKDSGAVEPIAAIDGGDSQSSL